MDHRDRLTEMLRDSNLAPLHKASIRYALGLIAALADELAAYSGTTVPGVIDQASKTVERGDG